MDIRVLRRDVNFWGAATAISSLFMDIAVIVCGIDRNAIHRHQLPFCSLVGFGRL